MRQAVARATRRCVCVLDAKLNLELRGRLTVQRWLQRENSLHRTIRLDGDYRVGFAIFVEYFGRFRDGE